MFQRFLQLVYQLKARDNRQVAQELQALFRVYSAHNKVAVAFNGHAAARARASVGGNVDVAEFAAVHEVHHLLPRNPQLCGDFVYIQHRPPREIEAVEKRQLFGAFGHRWLVF